MNDADFDGFEWDDKKSASVFKQRGIDFVAATEIFDGFVVEREDTRQNYQEQRFVTIGEIDGILITVVWAPRKRNRRIITAWPSSNQERRIYHEHLEIQQARSSQS